MSEYISGRNSVKELLKAGQKTVNKILLSRQAHGEPIKDIIKLAKERKIPVHNVPPEKFDSLGIDDTQGVAAEVSTAVYLELEELWDRVKETKNPLIVVMDGIEDPHNLGAIIRNAVVFGACGVVIGKWRAAGLTETVSRTSAGAVEHIPVARVTNIAEAISRLKEWGVWTVGAEAEGKPVTEDKFQFPMALVIGSEGQGLHRLVKERCDYLVSIPQTSTISSLNASCASAVLLHEIYKQK
ncbi:MAG: 23S rRNA (guanosine(2251)-2'-O)-methyltransferase RlmB [Elusimicrobiota bacterium]